MPSDIQFHLKLLSRRLFYLFLTILLIAYSGRLVFASEIKFISVPLNWENLTQSSKINLAYKEFGSKDPKAPVLIFIGGGPGLSSLDYFTEPNELSGAAGYGKFFRVVVFDQRGTGFSSPVHSRIDAGTVAKFYNSRSHVKDISRLIGEVAKNGEEVYLMGHSFGGIVIGEYLISPEPKPKISGIILASPAPSFIAPQKFMMQRIQEQIRLNKLLINEGIKELIYKAKNKILSLKHRMKSGQLLTPDHLNILWVEISTEEAVKSRLVAQLNKILDDKTNGPDIENELQWMFDYLTGANNKLTVFLSVSDLFRGQTDSEIYEYIKSQLGSQTEDWMFTELGVYEVISRSNRYKKDDKNSRHAARYALNFDEKVAKAALARVPFIQIAGGQDNFVPIDSLEVNFASMSTNSDIHKMLNVEDGDHMVGMRTDIAEQVSKMLLAMRIKPDCSKLLLTK